MTRDECWGIYRLLDDLANTVRYAFDNTPEGEDVSEEMVQTMLDHVVKVDNDPLLNHLT